MLTKRPPSVDSGLVRPERPDLVVLDVGLPDINGLEVLRRLRSFSDIPVIMLTGQDRDVDVAIFLREGADDYVVKPFSQIELIARIEAVMRRASSRMPVIGAEPDLGQPVERVEEQYRYEGVVNLHVEAAGDMGLVVSFVQQVREMTELRVMRLANNLVGGVDNKLSLRQPAPLVFMLNELNSVAEVRPNDDDGPSPGDEGAHLKVTLEAVEAPPASSQ